MAATHDSMTMILDYDAESDVLRVFVEPPREDVIAVPGGMITVLVTEERDRPIGIVIENFVGTLPSATPPTDRQGRQHVFDDHREAVAGIVPAMIRGFAPMAKDTVSRWIEMAAAR